MITKRISLFLALLLAASTITSCGDTATQETEAADTTANTTETEPAETEIIRANTPDSLPDNLDFGETTINVYYFGQERSAQYDGPAELTGDVVTDALYNRNISVEDRLNVKLNWIKGSDDWAAFPKEVENLMMAGSSDYDLILQESSRMLQQSVRGFYYDLMKQPYIDLSQPWWYNDLMEESSLDNTTRYFLAGDICLTVLFGASAAYFNKDMYIDYFGDVDSLYQTVLEGKWTTDKLSELSRTVATDLNGDGIMDDNDLMGFRYGGHEIVNYMSMSTGLDYITRDENGFPVLNLYTEETVAWAQTMYDMMFSGTIAAMGDKLASFSNSTSLFYLGELSTAHSLRNLDFSYGLVPYPKMAEELSYSSGAATANGCSVAIPVSAPAEKLDAVCATIEALCAEGYRTVTPAWYETALKIKYADNAIDAQMVDLIYENISSPFIMMADKAIGTGSIFAQAVYYPKSADYASYWGSKGKSYETALAKMIEDYKEVAGK